ncbi:MAG: (deoxy)nucleoside triphosphate pyrophosphohydrolase [Acholeplasmatales bacterium]|nr:(deoxy)nucleoside triphosphate pyrophosphohydrolase [Acholeplasmatales bacterium]
MKHVEVVCAIIVNDNNEIFVCKRGPGRALEGKWEFPGGKVEVNETHEQTIIREIKEELDSDILPIKYIGKNYHEYNDLNKPFSITMYGYICKLVNGELTLSEHTEKKWIRTNDLESVDFAGADRPFIDMVKKSF